MFAGNLCGDGCDQHCVASHTFPPSGAFQGNARMGRKCRLFVSSISSPDSDRRFRGPKSGKSPATAAKSPVLRRLSAETWCDLDCRLVNADRTLTPQSTASRGLTT
jgi:hypothetical protein